MNNLDLGDYIQIGTILVSVAVFFFRYGGEVAKLRIAVAEIERQNTEIRKLMRDNERENEEKFSQVRQAADRTTEALMNRLNDLEKLLLVRTGFFEENLKFLSKLIEKHDNELTSLKIGK